jgi:hypothetical protein
VGIDGTGTAGVFFGTAASPSCRAFARVLGEPEGSSPLAFYTPRELSADFSDRLRRHLQRADPAGDYASAAIVRLIVAMLIVGARRVKHVRHRCARRCWLSMPSWWR